MDSKQPDITPVRNKGGRPKGSPNKLTASIKAMMSEAFDDLGGVQSLVKWAKKEPTAFYVAWTKLAPKELDVSAKGPLEVTVRVVREDRRRTAS